MSRSFLARAMSLTAVAALSLGLAACGGGGGASATDLDSARAEATSTINSLPSLTESDKEEFSMQLSSAADKESIDRIVAEESQAVDHALARVRAMSPKATLERGYAIIADSDNASVTSVDDVEPGEQLMVFLADGRLVVEVDDAIPGPRPVDSAEGAARARGPR